jgi:hypothetical protein
MIAGRPASAGRWSAGTRRSRGFGKLRRRETPAKEQLVFVRFAHHRGFIGAILVLLRLQPHHHRSDLSVVSRWV